MFIFLQTLFASFVILGACTMVLIWLLLLVLSYSTQSGLAPWSAAGVSLLGIPVVAAAAILGVPSIVWVNHLACDIPTKWKRIAKMPRVIGTATLLLGLAALLIALVVNKLQS